MAAMVATQVASVDSGIVAAAVAALTPAEKRHLGALEKRIERGQQVFREVGEALTEIRDNRLYRETHATFDAYCRERWAFDRGRAYQLMSTAEVARAIPAEFPQIVNEAQARELVPLVHEKPSLVADVWREVVASDEPLSASRIRAVVRQHIAHEDTPRMSPTIALIGAIERLALAATKWLATGPGRAERNRVHEAVQRLNEVFGT